MPFEFEPLGIENVILIKPEVFLDDRGYFLETYKRSPFNQAGLKKSFVQDNYSYSKKGVLRGLHYQIQPRAQGKLISVIQGEIYDVAVDIRQGSPTFGTWVAERLSGQNKHMLFVPVGFAHGFQALSDEAKVIYKVTEEYAPELDRGIAWDDPELNISWPIHNPLLSEKDSGLPYLREAENNFHYQEERS